MLRLALESERAAVAQFNASAQECHDLGDHGTAALFEEMVLDEEKHADWFESQIEALMRVGLPQYLAQQLDTSASLTPGRRRRTGPPTAPTSSVKPIRS